MPKGPKGITAAQVHEACDKLIAEGTRPSIRAVRKVLGTGSETTILNHLKSWKGKQEQPLPPVADLPSEISDSIRLWVEKKSGDRVKALETLIQGMQADLTEIQEILGEKDETIENLKEDNERLQKELTSAQAETVTVKSQFKVELMTLVSEIFNRMLPEATECMARTVSEGLKAAGRSGQGLDQPEPKKRKPTTEEQKAARNEKRRLDRAAAKAAHENL